MTTKQNIARLFALIIIATTVSVSAPIYARKKLTMAANVAKMLTGAILSAEGLVFSIAPTIFFLTDTDYRNKEILAIIINSLATTNIGYLLCKNGYNNFKALNNSDEKADTTAPETMTTSENTKTKPTTTNMLAGITFILSGIVSSYDYYDSNKEDPRDIVILVNALAAIYTGYKLGKRGYNNFKALKNPDAQTDTKAIEFVS